MKYYNYETKYGLISIGEENGFIINLSFENIKVGQLEETPLIRMTYN